MPSIHSSYRLKSLFTHFPTIGPSSTYIWAISAAPASNPFGRCYSVKFQQTERRGKWISRCTILRRRIRDITKSQSLFFLSFLPPSLRTEKKAFFPFLSPPPPSEPEKMLQYALEIGAFSSSIRFFYYTFLDSCSEELWVFQEKTRTIPKFPSPGNARLDYLKSFRPLSFWFII